MTYNNLISEIRSFIKTWNKITINRNNRYPITITRNNFRYNLEIIPDDIHLNDKIDYNNIYQIKIS